MKRNLTLLVFLALLIGCTSVRDFLYDPIVSTDPDTGIVRTNGWEVSPGVGGAVALVGSVAPVPWAGMAANLVMAGLGVAGGVYGKNYKAAARSAVEGLDAYRQGTLKLEGGKEFDAKAVVALEEHHGTNGTGKRIAYLVKTFTGKTKG